jgi:hypothetical protein
VSAVGADLVGHDEARALLRRVRAPSLAFVGPPSVGRRAAALWWARWLNCEAPGDDACGRCASCRAFAGGVHPDVMVKAPPERTAAGRRSQRPRLTIGQMVPRDGPNEDREPLSRWLEQRPRFRRRVGIVDDADTLGREAGNAFLKTLEEPPSWATVVLIARSPAALLPTLASRCLIVRFGAAPVEEFADLAPHPALRTGQRGRLLAARAEPDAHAESRDAAAAVVAALDCPLGEALTAAETWTRLRQERPDLAVGEVLLEHLRRDAPERYPAALDVVHDAERALEAYASVPVVAMTLALRLRALAD